MCKTELNLCGDSIVNGTTDREAHPKRWIAVLVQMCTEKKVGEKLSKLDIENYIPIQQEIHQWSDRKKKIDRIVIPMVVFIHTDEKTEKQIRNFSFIYKILSYPGHKETAVIPDVQIERLKFMLKHAESEVQLSEKLFSIGETVRIARGPLKGLEGELCYVTEDKPMVAIRIECLGYACVNVSKADIESVKNSI
jgi:transcription antitermination factor NusG